MSIRSIKEPDSRTLNALSNPASSLESAAGGHVTTQEQKTETSQVAEPAPEKREEPAAEMLPKPVRNQKPKLPSGPKKRRVAEPIEKTLSLRVSENMLNNLNKESAIQGVSRSRLIQTAIQSYLDKQERKRAREQKNTG